MVGDAQRAAEGRRSAQHGGVPSSRWLDGSVRSLSSLSAFMAAPNSNSVFCSAEPCPAKYRTSARALSDLRLPFKAGLSLASPASMADPSTELARKSEADLLRVQSNAGYREPTWHNIQPADI